jgi:hypothetical protein
MPQIDLNLYGEQFNVFNDWINTDKNIMNIVPVGSGKTYMASFFLPIAASDVKYNRGRDVVYFAPTHEMCKTLIWEPLKTRCKEVFGITDEFINNGELTIKFPSGIFIRLKSAEARERLRGMNIGIAVLDEAALFHQEALLEISNRTRPSVADPTSGGRLIIISTPNGTNALYTMFRTALDMPDKWIVRHYTYEQMRVSDRSFVEQQRKILSPLKFAKDYLCSFESVEDKFFMAWDRTMCGEVVDRGGDLYTFHDFNSKRMCAIVAQVTDPGSIDGKIEVLDVYAIPNCNTDGIASAIRRDYNKRNIYSVIDATGSHNNRSTTSVFGVTDRTVLEKYGFRIINTQKSNPLIVDTDNSSNAFIARRGLVIKSAQKLLLEALDNYHYEDASRIKLVKYDEQNFAHIDALSDALRYGIHHLFGIKHHTSAPDYITDRPTRSPGSEYLKPSPLYAGGPSWEQLLSNGGDNEDYTSW